MFLPFSPGMLTGVPGIQSVQMTTNGVTLARRLPRLQAAGLEGVNISLDTLQPAKFGFITRRKGLEKVLQSVEKAVSLGLPHVKVLAAFKKITIFITEFIFIQFLHKM